MSGDGGDDAVLVIVKVVDVVTVLQERETEKKN